jgi:hypothetical protein
MTVPLAITAAKTHRTDTTIDPQTSEQRRTSGSAPKRGEKSQIATLHGLPQIARNRQNKGIM